MQINPFDMRGPEFLVFYAITCILYLLLYRYLIAQKESNWPMPKLNIPDPYEIAYLRGGESETLRVATLSLIDRGLLEISERDCATKNREAVNYARRHVEKAILTKFLIADPVYKIYTDEKSSLACFEYRKDLEKLKLLTSDEVYSSRRAMFYLGVFIILGLAGTKIFIALQRGRHNIVFLIMLATVFLGFCIAIYRKRRTALGDRAISDFQTLFKGLKDRSYTITAGGKTNEAALLACIFGVQALPVGNFPYIEKIFPKAKTNSSCATSSCGSSCSSSCGSSCGGGGCGGGCGGCGGD